MAVPTFTKTGAKATAAVNLDKNIFGLDVKNHQLLKDVYMSYLAEGRANLAVTKTRGEVRGGGRKPWRQKGTGRARFGSSRVPIWKGGGITFGPTGAENYSKKVNAKAKQLALKHALSLANKTGKIKVIDDFEVKNGKVKTAVDLLQKMDAGQKALIVVSQKDELVDRATRNLQQTKAVQANYLNSFDVLNADTVIISRKSLDMLSERFSQRAVPKQEREYSE